MNSKIILSIVLSSAILTACGADVDDIVSNESTVVVDAGDDTTAGDNTGGEDNTGGNDNTGGDDNTGSDDDNAGDDNTGGDDNSGDEDTNAGNDDTSGDDNSSNDDDNEADSGGDNTTDNSGDGVDNNNGGDSTDTNTGGDTGTGDNTNTGDDNENTDENNSGDNGGDNNNDLSVIFGGDSQSLEPALADRTDIIFYGGFEEAFNNDTWESQWGIAFTNREDRFELNQPGLIGTNSLRIGYPQGEYGTRETGGQFPMLMREMSALQDHPENHQLQSAHLRYYMQFEPGFSFSKGGKMPGLIGGGKSWQRSGGSQPDGTNGWTLRFMWRENGELFVYAYVPKSGNGKWGNEVWGQYIPTGVFMQPGQWHKIEQFVDVGTPGRDDGQLKVWIDGVERVNINDMRFWDVENENGPIGGLYFSTFHGGGNADWAPYNDSYALFDGFAIATDERLPGFDELGANATNAAKITDSNSAEIGKTAVLGTAKVLETKAQPSIARTSNNSVDNTQNFSQDGTSYRVEDSSVSGNNSSGYDVDATVTSSDVGYLTVTATGITKDEATGNICTGTITVEDSAGDVMTISFPDCDSYVVSYNGNANTYSQ